MLAFYLWNIFIIKIIKNIKSKHDTPKQIDLANKISANTASGYKMVDKFRWWKIHVIDLHNNIKNLWHTKLLNFLTNFLKF